MQMGYVLNCSRRLERTREMSPGESSPPYEPSLSRGLTTIQRILVKACKCLAAFRTHHPATASTSTPKPMRTLRGMAEMGFAL